MSLRRGGVLFLVLEMIRQCFFIVKIFLALKATKLSNVGCRTHVLCYCCAVNEKLIALFAIAVLVGFLVTVKRVGEGGYEAAVIAAMRVLHIAVIL